MNGANAGQRAMRAWGLVAAVMVGAFVVAAFGALRLAVYPGWQDTEGYLGHGLYIAEHGGFMGFLRDSFAGRFPITERHPLYLLLLAPFASREPGFFFTAKIIDLACGALTLVTLLWMARRRYGDGPALIAGGLFAVSQSLLVASSHVNHETQFVLAALGTWWWLTSGEGSWRWTVAGVCAGLAYMVKSSAILMIVGVVVAGLWRTRGRLLIQPRLWGFLLAVCIVASPLLVRNVRGFGTPIYEGVNTNIMWLDSWNQIGGEHSVMYQDRYGIKTVEKNGLPTARDYLKTHGPTEIAARLLKGIAVEIGVVGRKAVSPALPLPKPVAVVWGLAVLALAAIGWWQERATWTGQLLAVWSAAFVVFFGWNKLFPEFRYLAPLVPLWLALAGLAVWRMLSVRMSGPSAGRLAALVGLLCIVPAAGWTAANGSLHKPMPVIGHSAAYQRLLDWMNRDLEAGDRLLIGPADEFYGMMWMVERPFEIVRSPDVRTLEAFLRYLDDRRVTIIVFHKENAYGWGGQLAKALEPYLEVDPDGAIRARAALPGWRQVFADTGSPSRFLIYRSERAAER